MNADDFDFTVKGNQNVQLLNKTLKKSTPVKQPPTKSPSKKSPNKKQVVVKKQGKKKTHKTPKKKFKPKTLAQKLVVKMKFPLPKRATSKRPSPSSDDDATEGNDVKTPVKKRKIEQIKPHVSEKENSCTVQKSGRKSPFKRKYRKRVLSCDSSQRSQPAKKANTKVRSLSVDLQNSSTSTTCTKDNEMNSINKINGNSSVEFRSLSRRLSSEPQSCSQKPKTDHINIEEGKINGKSTPEIRRVSRRLSEKSPVKQQSIHVKEKSNGNDDGDKCSSVMCNSSLVSVSNVTSNSYTIDHNYSIPSTACPSKGQTKGQTKSQQSQMNRSRTSSQRLSADSESEDDSMSADENENKIITKKESDKSTKGKSQKPEQRVSRNKGKF